MTYREAIKDFEAIETHIRRARIERSVVLSQMIADGLQALGRGLLALKGSLESVFQAVMHRTISSDSLARRSVPRY